MDIRTEALLTAARDALAVPYPADPSTRLVYLDLCRDRGVAVRQSLDHAVATGDVDGAIALIDRAVAGMPATYPTDELWGTTELSAVIT